MILNPDLAFLVFVVSRTFYACGRIVFIWCHITLISLSNIPTFAFCHLVISGVSCSCCHWLVLVPTVCLQACLSTPGCLALPWHRVLWCCPVPGCRWGSGGPRPKWSYTWIFLVFLAAPVCSVTGTKMGVSPLNEGLPINVGFPDCYSLLSHSSRQLL